MSLSKKLILFVLAITAVLAAVLGGYFYFEFNEIFTEHTDNHLVSMAKSIEGQTFLFVEKAKIQVGDWSTDGHIKSEFEEILKTGDSAKIAELAEYIKINKHSLSPDIIITDIFTLDGKAIVSTFPARIGHHEGMEELEEEYGFESAIESDYGNAIMVTPGAEPGEPGHETDTKMWHISVPVFSLKTGKPIGIMVNHLKGDEIADILSGKWQAEKGALTGKEFSKKFETGEVYLVDKNGLMITPSRFVEDAVLTQKVETVPVKECLGKGKEFSGDYLNYLGAKVRGASMCLGHLRAVLVVEVGEEELFAEIVEEKNHLIVLTLVLAILNIPIIVLFSRFFLKNINIIAATAAKLSKGDLSVRAEVKAKDESGELAKAFNAMAENVEKSNSALKEREIQLESKVEEMERFTQLAMGREQKMIELKVEIENLRHAQKGN